MDGVRGQEKNPGEFRHSQNWIGGQGSTLNSARYIPPNPEDMVEAISDLEKYIHEEDEMDVLIKVALLHYQFETIHPFLDGNGRVGRLLINLFLIDRKILSTPALYISYYLKKNRVEYYDRLTEVRRKGNYEQWVQFFLKAILVSAEDATKRICELVELHNKNSEKISKMGRVKDNTMKFFEYLESNPIIEIKKTSEILGMSYNTVSSAVKRLMGADVLVQEDDNARNRTFAYKAYLDILRDGTLNYGDERYCDIKENVV
jgi:Fic family protein